MTTYHVDNRNPVLLVTTVASFLVPFMSSSVNVALPSIGKEFAMDAILLGWVTTSFLLAIAVFLIPFGRIADIYGRKKIFLYGFVIFTFASLLAAISRSPFLLILSRSMQGAGASMTISTMLAMLISAFPAEERGKVLGINVAAVYSGLSFGPFLGGLLTHYLGWRSIFFLNIPLGIPVLFLTFWKIKGDWSEAKGEKFDFLGSILSSFTLVTVMYGFSRLPAIDGGVLILLGAFGFLGFVKWEMRSSSPIFEIGLFRKNKAFAFSNLAAWINYGATFAVTFLLSLYLQLIKGLNPREAGLILVCQPVVQAIFSPFAGRLSDRMEPRIVASIGMGVTTVGLFFFIFLNEKTETYLILANLVVLGFGFALFASPNTNAVMSSVEKKLYGVASGILGTMRSTGMMFSMGITMLIFSLYIGRVQIIPPYYPHFLKSVRVLFVMFAVLSLTGIFASLAKGGVCDDGQ
jgi:EmrB/QacA subfamily drug resistance transporter